SIKMKNVEFDVQKTEDTTHAILFLGWLSNDSMAEIKNILLTSATSNFKIANGATLTYDGILCIGPTPCYYGSNFSDFCFDWSTEVIQLRAMSGSGFFQGKVTEEWLTSYKGFTKAG
ncbi:MAG: hypothetical protein IJB98_01245, partial [Clostridia bacterium]|nr:hypothetical protein [Clostridia bacterium]